MNNGEVEGKWKHVRGQAKVWGGQLTDAQTVRFEANHQEGQRSDTDPGYFGQQQMEGSAGGPGQGVEGKLTDDNPEQAGYKSQKVINQLQEKHGYTRAQAEKEFNRLMAEYEGG